MKRKATRTVSVRTLTTAAIIAALYVVLTGISAMLGIASGVIQVRLSEALTILPYFTSAAVPGVTIGCFLANLLTGAPLPDIIFGTLATFLGVLVASFLRKKKYRIALPTDVKKTLTLTANADANMLLMTNFAWDGSTPQAVTVNGISVQ